MKTLTSVCLALLTGIISHSLNARADWQPAISCDSGQFVVDWKWGQQGGFDYQMVLRGNVVRWLRDDIAAVSPSMINKRGEIVLSLGHGYKTEVTTRATWRKGANEYDQGGMSAILQFADRQRLEVTYAVPGSIGHLGTYYLNECWMRQPGH